MSILVFAETVRGAVTGIDINGQGSEARLFPGEPLTIRGTFKAQNPADSPTDTVQVIIFLDDKFYKCVFNDVPAKEPNYTQGSFEFKCSAPAEEGIYVLRAGWGYNWNWPEQAYKYLSAYPENTENIGKLIIRLEEKPRLMPLALAVMPIIGTIISLAPPKK